MKLQQDETLEYSTPLIANRFAELLEVCLGSTYFSYKVSFYEQQEGVAVGSSVSAVVANFTYEIFEELAI